MKFSRRISQLDKDEVKLQRIRRFLKEELGYWYKRGSSRSYLSMDKKLKYMQSIWAWQTLCDLHSNITYINVDESSFTKSVKTEYSWIPKGKSNPIVNTWATGRAVILFALFSNGDWIWYISSKITDSGQFWKFMLLVQNFIELWMHIKISQTRTLLDNASIHLSAFTKHVVKKLGLRMRFLPQYSPQLTPVELVFGMLKRKLSIKRKQKVIRFSSIEGRKEISQALIGFCKSKALRLWSVFVNESKKWIILWREEEIINIEDSYSREWDEGNPTTQKNQ